MKEEWRDISGYEGVYQVSSLGRVRRSDPYRNSKPGGILKPKVSTYGYHEVTLCKGNAKRSFKVHTLVAQAFISHIPDGMEINHKNGTKTDNRPSNLEIVTKRFNVLHSMYKLGNLMAGTRNGMSKLTPDDVKEIRKIYRKGGYTMTAIGKMYGVHFSTIQSAIKGTTWGHIEE